MPAIAITRIMLDTGFGRDLEQTWSRVQAGESAVRTTGEFDGAYVSRTGSAVDLASLAAAISEDGLLADTGVVMGGSWAPTVPPKWRGGLASPIRCSTMSPR